MTSSRTHTYEAAGAARPRPRSSVRAKLAFEASDDEGGEGGARR